MALQFPSASVGEIYSIAGSATYEWNGLYWDVVQTAPGSVISASISETASFAITASYIDIQALTGSIENALTASLARTASYAHTASLAVTASYSHTASLAHTSSYAYNFLIGNNLTVKGVFSASLLYAESSSIVYTSGSNVIGNSTSNTQSITGSVGITGSLELDNTTPAIIPNLTGSLFGTASWSINSITASYLEVGASSSYSLSSSFAISASRSITSSYSLTASYFSGSIPSSSFSVTASNSLTASTLADTATASLSLTSSYMLGDTGSVGNLTVTSIIVADYLLTKDYVDDAAAAADGVPLYGIYRSGNMVVVRIV